MCRNSSANVWTGCWQRVLCTDAHVQTECWIETSMRWLVHPCPNKMSYREFHGKSGHLSGDRGVIFWTTETLWCQQWAFRCIDRDNAALPSFFGWFRCFLKISEAYRCSWWRRVELRWLQRRTGSESVNYMSFYMLGKWLVVPQRIRKLSSSPSENNMSFSTVPNDR